MINKTYLICLIPSLIACADSNLAPVGPEKTISLKIQNYCPKDGYTFSEVVALNQSVGLDEKHKIVPDFDRDGLADFMETNALISSQFGIAGRFPDTNGDGYSDLVVYRAGIPNVSQVSLFALSGLYQDEDRDGLTDNEEALLHLDYENSDSDNDGISDYLEVRYALNPIDANDARQDPDGDGYTNIEEIKMNTPVRVFNPEFVNERAITYETAAASPSGIAPMSAECYNLKISNIPIIQITNGNLVRVFVSEINPQPNEDGTDQRRGNSVTVLVSRNIKNKAAVIINDIENQLIDGIIIPLVIEEAL